MCQSSAPDSRTRHAINDGQHALPLYIPDDAISRAVYLHAASLLHPSILAHSIRVFLLAQHLSAQESSDWHKDDNKLSLLFTACMFHDLGTTDTYDTGPVRFEVEGADAAVAFLTARGVSTEQGGDVWMAIALHDTPQIPERIPGLVRLVRLAVAADFKRSHAVALFPATRVAQIDTDFPRAEIEKVLGDAVTAQALKTPEKAPAACWPGGLLRSKLANPEWTGVNKAF